MAIRGFRSDVILSLPFSPSSYNPSEIKKKKRKGKEGIDKTMIEAPRPHCISDVGINGFPSSVRSFPIVFYIIRQMCRGERR